MRNFLIHKMVTLVVWVLCFICGGIGLAQAAKPIQVVATIGQITDVAQIIGGEQVEVKGLMGAGVDPHLYRATESDVMKLAEADIILYGGLYLESKMAEIFKKMTRSKTVVAVSESIDTALLLESVNYAGHYDPHVWFDVTMWVVVAETIAETFSVYDEEHQDRYRQRAAKYIKQLKELHAYINARSNELPVSQRVLVTAHDAFQYFGQQYGFTVLGLQGLSTETEAGTKDVMRLASFISEHRIKAVFVESSVPERNIKAVVDAVRAKGWSVSIGGELFSDAMGDAGTFEGTYIGMVTHNIDTIVGALK